MRVANFLHFARRAQVRRQPVRPFLSAFLPPHSLADARPPLARSCNKHVLSLGHLIKSSLTRAGITGYQFGTVGVSDGISMGTFGMSYSLQSRDLIADSVETAAGGHWLDGMVTIPVRSPPPLPHCEEALMRLGAPANRPATRTCPSPLPLSFSLRFLPASGRADDESRTGPAS